MSDSIKITHDEFVRVLRRAGYSAEVIEELSAQLPDPVDADRDASILSRYGVTRGRLMDLMGASP